MSIVARVFVVLNFILSIVFMILAMDIWTAKTKWQKMYEQEKINHLQNLKDLQARRVELAQGNVFKEQEIVSLKATVKDQLIRQGELEDQNLKVNSELIEARNRQAVTSASLEESRRRETQYVNQIMEHKNILIKQQQALEVARQNELAAKNERAEMEVELNTNKTQLAAVLRDKQKIAEDLAYQTRRIEALYLRGIDVAHILQEDPQGTQKDLPGAVVLAVRPDLDLIMISKGSIHGVELGYQFTIYRENKFVAKCQVEKVFNNMCAAKIIRSLSPGDVEVQVNDQAASRP